MSHEAESEEPDKPRKLLLWVCGVLVASALLHVCYGLLVTGIFHADQKPLEKSGQLGDTFGALNSFAAGAAMLLVAISLWFQSRDLSNQTAEMRRTISELTRQRMQLERSLHASVHAEIVKILQPEHVRDARRQVMTHLSTIPWKEWIESGDVKYAETVAHTYDVAGQMAKFTRLPDEWIDSWAESIASCWEVLEPWIEHVCDKRNYSATWNEFRDLAKMARLKVAEDRRQREEPAS